MTSGDDQYRIPLEFTTDTGGLEQAQRAAEKFDGTAAELTQTLADLQKQAVATFNALQKAVAAAGGGTGGKPLSSYAELQALAPAIAGARYAPVLAQMQQVEALSRQTPRAAPTAPGEEHGGGQSRSAAAQRPFSERLTERVLRTSSLSTLGAFAQGEFVAGGRSLARAFMETLVTTGASAGAARTITTAVAAQVAASGAGGAGGGGAEEAAAGGAAGGGIARVLGALTSGPLGAILAGVAGIGALALGADTIRAQMRGTEYGLRASIGGAAGADMSGVATGILGVGQRYLVDPKTAFALANQLGGAGVGQNQMGGALSNTLAMSRLTGLDPSQIGQITAALIVQGHATATEVGAVFQALRTGAERSGQSLTKLVASLQDFQRITGGGALGVSGAAGLVAIQGLIGPAASAGQLVAPALGATGTQALQAAGILGISPERLQRIQDRGDTAQMFDLMAAAAKRIGGGRTDQTTIDALEAAFQNAGVLNLAGIAPRTATGIIRTMVTQSPRAAEDARDRQLQADAQQNAVARAHALQDAGTRAAGDITSAANRIALALQYTAQLVAAWNNNINAGGVSLAATTPYPQGSTISPAWSTLGKAGMRIPNSRGGTDTLGPQLATIFGIAADRTGVPAALLEAVGARESDLRSSARAPDGGLGLMQFMPQTIDALRKRKGNVISGMSQADAVRAVMDPHIAAQLGGTYLSQLYTQAGGNWQAALGMYNGGPNWQQNAAARAYASSTYASAQQIAAQIGALPPGASPAPVALPGPTPVSLSGTLTVVDSKGTRIGTATIAPQTVTVNPNRPPKGGFKGNGPTPTPPPHAPHPGATPTPAQPMPPPPTQGPGWRP